MSDEIIFIQCCQFCELIIPLKDWVKHTHSEKHIVNVVTITESDLHTHKKTGKYPQSKFPLGIWKMTPIMKDELDDAYSVLKKWGSES